ncbi:ABC transporter substrate-binding protein [Mesorhizobium sp. VK23B]|uniref:ABC transporter substrate-binding protein n=1 Tax=Mesorhizobium dulcispinae TaxID=3072316 RepID=A0ABU4XP74_9HYPH|nr:MULTISPECIES: ABC transporter substrate-binding protein [unclassified Mesorhizobium]MDX8470175.1 ABC transporter substrate-binding protein [Mesorhizobium sp. VK23B]MDX8476549.1 ABC transporter substrate-binding protein [Mesorhizobium sp. VK23A]
MKHLDTLTLSLWAVALFAAPTVAQADEINLDVITQNGTFYQAVVDAYEASGAKYKVTLQAPSKTYDEVAQRAVRAAMIGTPPDVVFMGYDRMKLAKDRKIAMPLDDLLGSDQELEKLGYPASALNLCRIGGKLYGLPFATSVPAIFFNSGLVKQVGGDPEAFPDTWDGIFELASKINGLGSGKSGIFFRYDHSGNWSWQALVTSFGGQLMNADGKTIAFNGPAGHSAFAVLSRLKNAGMVDLSTDQAKQSFMSGNLGIYFDSSASLIGLQKGSQFRVGTAQYPSPVSDSRLPGGGNCAMLTTPKAERQEAALDFMKFATGPIGQTALVKETGYISTNTLANNNPEYLGNFYKNNPAASTALEALPRLTPWKSFPGENSPKIVDLIRGYLQSVITHKADPDKALQDMAAEIKPLLP